MAVTMMQWLFVFVLALSARHGAAKDSQKCERLSLKTPLTYSQEKAPRDLSGVLPVVVEKVNRVLEGVVDVEVEWDGGDLHGRVGEHIVRCRVTRLESAVASEHRQSAEISTDAHGRKVIVQCFHIPFTIVDTNECQLPTGHSMRHQCHEPSVCVNTIGSYECVCPRLDGSRAPGEVRGDDFWQQIERQDRSPWELSFNSTALTTCPGSASTHGCCPVFPHSTAGRACRAAFRCPTDSCRGGHDCAHNARCERTTSPLDHPNYTCKCPEGLMGNGRACRAGIDPKPQPKVKFDGVTPTEETIKNNFYCGCTKPVVDACAGFPPCTGNNEICAVASNNEPKCICKAGYVDDGDGYGCVDETPPLLRLRDDAKKDQTLRLKQGDFYKEHAVDIIDENAEEYARSLKITYSKPLPPGCLAEMGEFHVNYTVATPWTAPPYVRITRRVIIENINECSLDIAKYETQCPELIPQCDLAAGATCVDTIGSYTCRCPEHTSGDGFKAIHAIDKIATPQGYKGGTGCVDTSKPSITILGPNPKVLRVCKCGGLVGVMSGKSSDSEDLCNEQRKRYDSELKEMVRSTAGAELCATPDHPHPTSTDCVKAVDHTYKGQIDISKRVKVGEPVQKSATRWSVPYNVIDDAGNQAKTAWRDVVIEEVDVLGLENRVRADLQAEKEAEVKRAVDKALSDARVEVKTSTSSTRRSRGGRKTTSTTTCPPCPECTCPTDGSFDPSMCESICEKKIAEAVGTCVPGDERHVYGEPLPFPFGFLQELPPLYTNLISWAIVVIVGFMILKGFGGLFYKLGQQESYQHVRPGQNERDMQGNVRYYQTSPQSAPPHRGGRPREAAGNGMFSPPQNRVYGGERTQFWSPPPGSLGRNGDDDIYADGTPSSKTPGRSPRY